MDLVVSDLVVAIDGPAGAGKSTVAKLVASQLGLRYLDTGAMYRAFAFVASRAGIGREDQAGAEALAATVQVSFGPGEPQRVIINGEDVTDSIRTPEISDLASALSVLPGVRRALVEQQKQIVAGGGVVLEGRDTTSVIAPDAEVKVFLTASLEERAIRRAKELQQRGSEVPLEELTRQIAERDHRDYTRDNSPLVRVPGVHVLETYGLAPAEVANVIIAIAKSHHHAATKRP